MPLTPKTLIFNARWFGNYVSDMQVCMGEENVNVSYVDYADDEYLEKIMNYFWNSDTSIVGIQQLKAKTFSYWKKANTYAAYDLVTAMGLLRNLKITHSNSPFQEVNGNKFTFYKRDSLETFTVDVENKRIDYE